MGAGISYWISQAVSLFRPNTHACSNQIWNLIRANTPRQTAVQETAVQQGG
jgi:hypothetical protein